MTGRAGPDPTDAPDGLRLAVGTLGVVPVGDVGEVTRGRAAWAMTPAPVAAFPVGAAVARVTGDTVGAAAEVAATVLLVSPATGVFR